MSQAEIEAQVRGCVREAIEGPRGLRGLVATIKAHVPGAIVTLDDCDVTVDTHADGELVKVVVPLRPAALSASAGPRRFHL